jgi:hypothetical protein
VSTHVEPEQLEITPIEKVLALVLAAFILVGGVWAYLKLDEVAQPTAPSVSTLAPAQRDAIRSVEIAQEDHLDARYTVSDARRDLVLKRERYRTALDAGEAAPRLKAAYGTAQRRLDTAEKRLMLAEARLDKAEAAARPAEAALRRLEREYSRDQDRHDLIVLGLRLVLVLGGLAGALVLLGRLRRRHSRYLPAALAWVGAWAALALVMAGDYVGGAIDVTDVGPLALSVGGIALTLLAFVGLHRYLARRIPLRRVRRGECPFCGFPARGEHCEGCGRQLMAPCASCEHPRRVGSAHCVSCGSV